MDLGKKIYEQRTRRNLSQGDLANLLNVSRQSVSKWENNSAVPDLEKIIKLSEIFEISLDELIKGNTSEAENVQVVREVIIQSPKQEGRKIAGIVLFCMAFIIFIFLFAMSGSLGAIIYALPFLICGTICFLCRKNVGFWCCWAIYLLIDLFLRWATGITIGLVRLTLIYTPDMNYTRLFIAWILLIFTLLIMGITIFKFTNGDFKLSSDYKKYLFAGWIGFLLFNGFQQWYLRTEFYFNLLQSVDSLFSLAYPLLSFITDWTRRIVFILLIVYTIRYYKSIHMK